MNKNVRIALVIALVLLVWLISGLFVSSDTSQSLPSNPAVSTPPVEVATFNVQQYSRQLTFRAYTEEYRAVDVRAQVAGRVGSLPVAEGAKVVSGDLLCELDKEDRPQRLSEAEAELARAQIEYQGALKLKKGGYQSEVAIAQAGARLKSAEARLARAGIDLANSDVVAPFDGVLEHRFVEQGDFIQPGQPCVTLLQMNPLKVIALVNEQEVSLINQGDKVEVELVTGEQLPGKVIFIGSRSQGNTRSFLLEVSVENPEYQLRAGVSAVINYSAPSRAAHLLPSHLLLLNGEGELHVRSISDDAKVISLPVQSATEEPQGAWVEGLPESVDLIIVGQNYVSDGESVEVIRRDAH